MVARKAKVAVVEAVAEAPVAPTPFQIALKHLGEHVRNDELSRYGTVSADGKVVTNKFTGCHAEIHNGCFGAKPQAIWSVTPKPDAALSKEAYKHWCDYLVHRSPWKQVVIPDLDTEFVMEHGVVCPTNVPSNFLVNMLIATRMPREHVRHVTKWHDLVKSGAQEDMAVIFACMLGNGLAMSPHAGNGHHPFDMFTKTMVKNFVNHHYGSPNPNYIDNKNYYPCSAGWGDGAPKNQSVYGWNQHDEEKYFREIKKLYSGEKSGAGRMFNVSSAEKAIEHTFEEWVKIINKEHERLFDVKETQAQAGGDGGEKAIVRVRKRPIRRERILAHVAGRVRARRKA